MGAKRAFWAFTLTSLMILFVSFRARSEGTATPAAKKEITWVGCGITLKAFMNELAKAYYKKSGVKINLEGGGATRGIRDTAVAKSNMGGSCRHILPIDEERNISLIQVGWDALVVIVNPKNPINEISLEDLKKTLEGTITNWKQLGGEDKKIKLVARSGKISGVGMMTRELIFNDRDKNFAKDAIELKSSGPLETFVEKNPYAIGISGISSAKRRKVKILKLDGVYPSYHNVSTGKYQLYRPLYLVIPKDENGRKPIKGFIEFALSDEGQAVIKKAGTVTLEDGAGLLPVFQKKMLDAETKMGDY